MRYSIVRLINDIRAFRASRAADEILDNTWRRDGYRSYPINRHLTSEDHRALNLLQTLISPKEMDRLYSKGYIQEITPKKKIYRITYGINYRVNRWNGRCWMPQNIVVNTGFSSIPNADNIIAYLYALRANEDEFARVTCGEPMYGEGKYASKF